MKLKPEVTRYLLCGKRGLSMMEEAKAFAESILQTKNLSKHPDFLSVKLGDKKELTVEDAEAVISKTSLVPAVAESTVVIIDSFESMNTTAQNKLLKTLEDAKRVYLILIAYGIKGVLPTVESRCTLVRYAPLSLAEWKPLHPDDDFCSYYTAEGCPGALEERKDLLSMFQEAWSAFAEEKFENLLPAFHLLTEKDKDSVTASPYVHQTLAFLNACAVRKLSETQADPLKRDLYLKVEQLIGEDIEKQGRRYSKDNFFLLIARIISLSKGGK